MILKYDIVDIEKPDKTCSPNFVANEFQDFYRSSNFSIKHSFSNNNILTNDVNKCLRKALQRYKNLYFLMLFHENHVCFVLQKNEGNSVNKNHRGV